MSRNVSRIITWPNCAEEPVAGTASVEPANQEKAMAVGSMGSSSISGSSTTSGSNVQATVAALERQLAQIEKKISKVTSDSSLSADLKQQELALYQVQAQLIEAQIQQLQQAQQKQVQETSKAKTQSSSDNRTTPATSTIDVVA
jgi:FlxA-like protein/Actin cytoskeleton-regulatory complex protein END3